MTKYAIKNVIGMIGQFFVFLYTVALLIVKGITRNVDAVLEYI